MSWLQELLVSTRELEAPQSFYYWSGLATISAVVKDNIWIDRAGLHNLYPNIYVMFHADSGLRKGPPISFARDCVKAVNNTRIIRGRSSIQGILKELGTAYTIPGGKVVTKSVAFIVSSELTSSLIEDKAAARILTDLYDRQYNEGEWRQLLKMDQFSLKDPTLTMLTATNEAQSEEFFSKQDIQGGYFARTFIIYESKRNVINPLVIPLKNPPNPSKFVPYLKELSALEGPFEPIGCREKNDICNIEGLDVSGETVYYSKIGKIYTDWYINFTQDVDNQEFKDKTGTVNRFGDSVLKVAMLISLSKKPILKIDEESMMEAITVCERLIGAVRKTTMGKEGKSNFAFQKTLILDELMKRENHMITRPQLLKKYWMHFGSDELDQFMKSFDDSGLIKTQMQGNIIIYTMPQHQVKIMQDWLDGKIEKTNLIDIMKGLRK